MTVSSVQQVPVPPDMMRILDGGPLDQLSPTTRLWRLSRCRAWQLIKIVMDQAAIADGPHDPPKGLRHGFGLHAIRSGIPPNWCSVGSAMPAWRPPRSICKRWALKSGKPTHVDKLACLASGPELFYRDADHACSAFFSPVARSAFAAPEQHPAFVMGNFPRPSVSQRGSLTRLRCASGSAMAGSVATLEVSALPAIGHA